MKDILANHFPEDNPHPDVLGGLPEFSYGQATEYFSALSTDDCEIIHWYMDQGISPSRADSYVADLIGGYAVVDPLRTSQEGVTAALNEIARVRRYIELLAESDDYFPVIESFNVAVRDENGKYEGSVDLCGWGSLGRSRDSLEAHKTDACYRLGIVDDAAKFITDPAQSRYFSQFEIIKEHKMLRAQEELEAEELVLMVGL